MEKPCIREDVKCQYAEAEKRVLDRIDEFSDRLGKRCILSYRAMNDNLQQKKIEPSNYENQETAAVAIQLNHLNYSRLSLEYLIVHQLWFRIDSFIYCINNGNHLSLALGSRSLIDHATSFTYLIDTTRHQLERLRGLTGHQSIKEILDCLSDTFWQVHHGLFRSKELEPAEQIRLNNLRKKYLETKIPPVEQWYSYLSGLLHPDFVNKLLVYGSDLKEAILNSPVESRRMYIKEILRIDVVMIAYLDMILDDLVTTMIPIAIYEQRRLLPETTLATFFVEPLFRHTGDGKTRETAIFFTGNLSHMQSIEMQYRYMRYHRLMSTMQSMEKTDQCFMYDIQTTQDGDLWFKVPNPDLLHPWK
jgi:hypothetical protein